ncbi:hypothetical protein Tco_1168143 [Tanacetum coccineum]
MVPWILAQYLSKKVAGLREASDINGGHYVSRIACNLGYFTPNETKNCSALVEGTLLDNKALKGILDNSKMRIKENDVEKSSSKPKDKKSKKGYKAKKKSNTSGYTFASDNNPPMVPPYPYSTTPFTSMENAPNAVVEHVEELMRCILHLEGILEEIHVTWAYLEKKWTRLRTYTNIAQEFLYSGWRRRHKYNVMPSQ